MGVAHDISPGAIIMLTRRTAERQFFLRPDDERLRRLFNLTPAELRLASHLVVGATLEEVTKLTNVTLPTLRSQLAALFRKTGTSRQSELIRRLLSAPWQIGMR